MDRVAALCTKLETLRTVQPFQRVEFDDDGSVRFFFFSILNAR